MVRKVLHSVVSAALLSACAAESSDGFDSAAGAASADGTTTTSLEGPLDAAGEGFTASFQIDKSTVKRGLKAARLGCYHGASVAREGKTNVWVKCADYSPTDYVPSVNECSVVFSGPPRTVNVNVSVECVNPSALSRKQKDLLDIIGNDKVKVSQGPGGKGELAVAELSIRVRAWGTSVDADPFAQAERLAEAAKPLVGKRATLVNGIAMLPSLTFMITDIRLVPRDNGMFEATPHSTKGASSADVSYLDADGVRVASASTLQTRLATALGTR